MKKTSKKDKILLKFREELLTNSSWSIDEGLLGSWVFLSQGFCIIPVDNAGGLWGRGGLYSGDRPTGHLEKASNIKPNIFVILSSRHPGQRPPSPPSLPKR
jgi:hypothetical protein